jgi:hypothetical protein
MAMSAPAEEEKDSGLPGAGAGVGLPGGQKLDLQEVQGWDAGGAWRVHCADEAEPQLGTCEKGGFKC